MKIVEQNELSAEQKLRIAQLWNAQYPASLAYGEVSGFDDYLNNLGDKKHFLLIDPMGEILGWALIFERENAKWLAILIDGKIQGQSFGIKLIDALKAAENRLLVG